MTILKSKKILIVDDEADLLVMVENILRIKGGYENIFATKDGFEALRMVAAIKPDIIILDLMLPGIDGWVVAKRLKNNPPSSKIPIIAITAHAGYGQESKILEAGFVHCIPKPFKIDVLLKAVESCLNLGESKTA